MSDMASKAILVVDDSSTMRRILKNTLMRCGFTKIDEACDGLDGLGKCKAAQYDCVMTDWNMPQMDGLQLVINLRQLPNYKKVPIVMVTTEGGKTDVIEALTRGVTSYIIKPFTEEILKKKMEGVFPSGAPAAAPAAAPADAPAAAPAPAPAPAAPVS